MREKRVVCTWPQLPHPCSPKGLTCCHTAVPHHCCSRPVSSNLWETAVPPLGNGLSLTVMSLRPLPTSRRPGLGSPVVPASPQHFRRWSLTVPSLRGDLLAACPLSSLSLHWKVAPRGLSLSLAADLSDHEVAACLSDKTIELV